MTGESVEPSPNRGEIEVIPIVSREGLESLIEVASRHLRRIDELHDGRTQDRPVAEEIRLCNDAMYMITGVLDKVIPRPEGSWEEVAKSRAQSRVETTEESPAVLR